MATRTPPPPKAPDWEAIELAFKSTRDPVNAIATRYNASEATLRRRAKKFGWVRCAAEEKRQVVSDALAGVTNGMSPDEIRRSKAMEAATDILDMKTGVEIYRNILTGMKSASEVLIDPKRYGKPDPRVAKNIVEATDRAVSGLRTIRELDKSSDPRSSEELDAVIDSELERLASGAKAGPA